MVSSPAKSLDGYEWKTEVYGTIARPIQPHSPASASSVPSNHKYAGVLHPSSVEDDQNIGLSISESIEDDNQLQAVDMHGYPMKSLSCSSDTSKTDSSTSGSEAENHYSDAIEAFEKSKDISKDISKDNSKDNSESKSTFQTFCSAVGEWTENISIQLCQQSTTDKVEDGDNIDSESTTTPVASEVEPATTPTMKDMYPSVYPSLAGPLPPIQSMGTGSSSSSTDECLNTSTSLLDASVDANSDFLLGINPTDPVAVTEATTAETIPEFLSSPVAEEPLEDIPSESVEQSLEAPSESLARVPSPVATPTRQASESASTSAPSTPEQKAVETEEASTPSSQASDEENHSLELEESTQPTECVVDDVSTEMTCDVSTEMACDSSSSSSGEPQQNVSTEMACDSSSGEPQPKDSSSKATPTKIPSIQGSPKDTPPKHPRESSPKVTPTKLSFDHEHEASPSTAITPVKQAETSTPGTEATESGTSSPESDSLGTSTGVSSPETDSSFESELARQILDCTETEEEVNHPDIFQNSIVKGIRKNMRLTRSQDPWAPTIDPWSPSKASLKEHDDSTSVEDSPDSRGDVVFSKRASDTKPKRLFRTDSNSSGSSSSSSSGSSSSSSSSSSSDDDYDDERIRRRRSRRSRSQRRRHRMQTLQPVRPTIRQYV